MKKFISLLPALVMALSLVACGAKNDTKTDDTANPDLVICDWQFEVDEKYEANVILITKGETELLAAAWAEFAESTAAGYSCPIPAEAVPTIPE